MLRIVTIPLYPACFSLAGRCAVRRAASCVMALDTPYVPLSQWSLAARRRCIFAVVGSDGLQLRRFTRSGDGNV